MPLKATPIHSQTVAGQVFDTLQRQILDGSLAAGETLPAERALADALGVSRTAVREAMRRLQEAGLVDVRHGSGSTVRDFSRDGGFDLLPKLLLNAEGKLNLGVARGILSMRATLGVDAVRQCARRGRGAPQLQRIVAAMRTSADDLPKLQQLTMDYWRVVVDGSGNLAYRLSFNTLDKSYRAFHELLRPVLEAELRDIDALDRIAVAVAARDVDTAEAAARAYVAHGTWALEALLERTAASGGDVLDHLD